MTHWQNLMQIKYLCVQISNNFKTEDIIQLENIIHEKKTRELLRIIQRDLLATFYLVLKEESQNKSKLKVDDKLMVIRILDEIFAHTQLENDVIFFNFFGFLLKEIYDNETHKIKTIQEEHKLVVLSCVKSLLNSTSSDLIFTLYTKENGKRLCKMIYVAVEIGLHEKFRALRIEAIECLMAIYKVHSDSDYGDPVYRSLIAESFSYFLPGVASCLRNVALEDEKVGFKLIKISIKAMGRILSLLMQDYKGNSDNISSVEHAKSIALFHLNQHKMKADSPVVKTNKLDEYMEDSRTPRWFEKCDMYLSKLLMSYRKLTQHQMMEVRKELAEMCVSFIEKCSRTMPTSQRYIVDILIILSEDQDSQVSQMSRNGLNALTILLSDDQNRFLMNKMQDGFYDTFSQMPAIFNGIDNKEKVAILKLTCGYVNLFGSNLMLHGCFRQFMHVLLHLCEFEIVISTFNENAIQDLESDEHHTLELWKNLKFLKDESVRLQFTYLCHTLVKNNLFETLTDFLISIYQKDADKKEATYLLNEIISGLISLSCDNKCELIKPLLHLYIEPKNWNLSISNECDENLPLRVLRNNIQQATLNVNGLGIMADVLMEEFRPFLLKSLFLVLTRAGSKQPLIQAAGRRALKAFANAFNCSNITTLINENMDYFVFYIERNLKNDDIKGNAFDVMELVIMYGNKDTLDNLLSIVEEVLVQSCDKFKQKMIDAYLKFFKTFLKSLLKWFSISAPSPVLGIKAQKEEEELRKFKVTGLEHLEEITDFSDNIMDKSAEELYEEDMGRKRNEVDIENLESKVEEYKKPEPPTHIKLTVEILKRCLHFLPSKEKERKLLVLEILRNGLEIIREFEDELLPVVHLIWSPLVARFKEIYFPVIINYSFLLLTTMARLSKDFIRNRTAKDVLPSVLEILRYTSKESHLKDKGSAYRYTQSYKLQMIILKHLAYLASDIGLMDKDIEKIMDVVSIYLSDKQPLPLQCAAVTFFQLIIRYEPNLQTRIQNWLTEENKIDYAKNINKILDECGKVNERIEIRS